jgi:predicted RND superfamily exporter protein
MEAYVRFLLSHRYPVITLIGVFSLLLGYYFQHIRIYINFRDLYPPNHPYMQLSRHYSQMFGSANVLVIALEVKDRDIFNLETLHKVDRITRYLLETPGVNGWGLTSISHPRVRDVKVDTAGITALPLFHPGPPQEPEDIARLKRAIYTNPGILNFLVSEDHTTTLITAQIWETGVDYGRLMLRLQEIKKSEEDANHTLHITGYPMLFAWIFSYKSWLLYITGLTVFSITGLLWFYFRTLQGVVIPLFSGLLSTFWALGFAGLFGFHIDPLVLVVFLLITARALSHSVQSMERYHEEYRRLGNKDEAILQSYLGLFSPALVSICSDGLAILTLAVAHIPLIQKLAFVSSFWVFTISISVVTLHPIILSFTPPPKQDPRLGKRLSDKIYTGINRGLVRISRGGARYATVALFALALAVGLYYSQRIKIGDVSIGKALFYLDHPYNTAYDRIIDKSFVGISQLIIIAEGQERGVFKTSQALNALEQLQKHMEKHNLAGGSLSAADLIRQIFQQFEENIPKWAIIPDDSHSVGNLLYWYAMSAGVPQLERFVDKDFQNATVTIFFKDYTHDTVMGALEQAKTFITTNVVDGVRFRLAAGLFGILAAVNEEVEWSYRVNLYLVVAAVFILSFLTYRSITGALIVMIPSIVAQPLTEAVMYWLSIDMNINSLPVAAIGIGIGIDYGYYILSRIVEEYDHLQDMDLAVEEALMTTGRAILFTGTTLTASVIFWLFFPMKFQAEMALLLTLILFLHLVGALVFIPSTVSFLKPRFATARAARRGA